MLKRVTDWMMEAASDPQERRHQWIASCWGIDKRALLIALMPYTLVEQDSESLMFNITLFIQCKINSEFTGCESLRKCIWNLLCLQVSNAKYIVTNLQ